MTWEFDLAKSIASCLSASPERTFLSAVVATTSAPPAAALPPVGAFAGHMTLLPTVVARSWGAAVEEFAEPRKHTRRMTFRDLVEDLADEEDMQ